MVYTREALVEKCYAGEKFKYLFFWKPTITEGEITESCLGQWWMCPFAVDGVTYSCAEQYMMAEKARLFHDEAMLDKIMNTNYPKEMKAYGRAVQNFQDEVWESKAYSIVKKGNIAKFSQNPELGGFLKKTRDKILVEASPYDRIWGIGMAQDNPDINNPFNWNGSNLLGFALMDVRKILWSQTETKVNNKD